MKSMLTTAAILVLLSAPNTGRAEYIKTVMPYNQTLVGSGLVDTCIGDMDGDGIMEIAGSVSTGNSFIIVDPSGDVKYIGEGSIYGPPMHIFMVDLDSDSRPELVVSAPNFTCVVDYVPAPASDSESDSQGRSLSRSQPNPSNGEASIAFDLRGRSRVQLAIYDVSGRLVSQLADGTLRAGRYSIPWDGKDDSGQVVASGTYFYQLTVDGREESRRMVVIR